MSSALEVGSAFMTCLAQHDVNGALTMCAPHCSIQIVPLALEGAIHVEGRAFFENWFHAFPDLSLTTRRMFATRDDVVAVETSFDGTQANAFLGAINQEKHVDLDEAWLLRVNADYIENVKLRWCQNQLYRRLAVRRLDRVTITT
ncbi:ester cyclase [Paraburkholderia sp. DHOC27]|uniref:ester cyclase n=1 Tax=Paraburkholderia sp. DHOC27 TaxID=2303330 RepID=UPI000E3D90EB|nr:ester cyclase [Paraburkholderia sp. DHOC27]RFU45242.1 nuclear transport factor 2 family protein [Paraburkholderia sp. DHOC27]